MIVIKVEIWPGGDESRKYEHSRAYINNLEETTNATKGEYGDYECRFMQSRQFNPKRVWKKSVVKRMHRVKRGVWDIIGMGLVNGGILKRNLKDQIEPFLKKTI
ncbi:hypothetical protein [Leptospira noguchii]|uniref:hypothetical protein n=1 Tax=Leptospira noguchii TaxID=28182 RepID=UPI0007737F1E|nr:hypothetical protein [Leptospira noguchii]UOG61471.1 hypothetical protein MAL07_05475 [Leptospira noguchii]